MGNTPFDPKLWEENESTKISNPSGNKPPENTKSKRLRDFQFKYEQLNQIKDEQTFDRVLRDVNSTFKGQNYNQTMQLLSDRYGITDTNAALIDFLYNESVLTSILNDINKKGR